MAFDIISRPFARFPSIWDDDMDLPLASTTPGGLSVSEDEKYVYISASLPGVEEKDIDLTFDKGSLWIKGESKQEEEDKKRKYYHKAASSFSYRLTVPGDLDPNVEPEASCTNGVLTVKFTKSPSSQPKKISVKSTK